MCYSEELTLPSGIMVVVGGAEVFGEIRSVTFLAKNVTCDVDPDSLLKDIENYITLKCSGAREEAPEGARSTGTCGVGS